MAVLLNLSADGERRHAARAHIGPDITPETLARLYKPWPGLYPFHNISMMMQPALMVYRDHMRRCGGGADGAEGG